jgi:hypothetical protein
MAGTLLVMNKRKKNRRDHLVGAAPLLTLQVVAKGWSTNRPTPNAQ